jgi:hypothetical protein
VLDDLTAAESALVATARAGEVPTRKAPIRAALIRELLLGKRGDLDPRGVRLHGARVTGELQLDDVTSTWGLELVDCDIEQVITLACAQLPHMVLTKSRLAGIEAGGARITGDLRLTDATVRREGERGAVRLRGTHVGGRLSLEGMTAHNDSGPALFANGVHVDGGIHLRQARMTGRGDAGAVSLHHAHIGTTLNLEGAELRNDDGPALVGYQLAVTGDVSLRDAQLHGAGARGAVRLRSARGGNDFYLVNAKITNDDGPALYLDGLHLGGSLVLVRSEASGAGEDGTIWLLGAHVAGLRFADSLIRNDSGPALFPDQLQATGIVLLQQVTLKGAGHATIRLAGASAGGQFTFKDTTVTHPDGVLIDVNDFAYGSLAGVDWRQWLDLIRNHTKDYRPSPYQQLAAVERKAGHDGNARDILIAQQQDLRRRAPQALGGWLTQRFHWLWGALAGYGYRARRTALALLIALVAAGGVTLWAGHTKTGPESHAAERTAAPHAQCSTVELIGLGLDRGLPLGPTGSRDRCDLDTETTAGQVFTVLLWIVQAAVWGLATLALAGYTGLIRKTA